MIAATVIIFGRTRSTAPFMMSVTGSWSSVQKARGAAIEAGLLRRSTSGP